MLCTMKINRAPIFASPIRRQSHHFHLPISLITNIKPTNNNATSTTIHTT